MDMHADSHRATATELLSHLKSLGVKLSVKEGRLIVDAPRGAIAADLKAELARRKPELVLALADPSPPPPDDPQVPPLTRVDRSGPLPLSFSQERLWFLSLLEPENTAYNISAAYRLIGPLRPDVLERSLATIVARHEALRTHFEEVDGTPVQVIAPPGPFRLPLTDLAGLPPGERDAAIAALNAREAGRLCVVVGPNVQIVSSLLHTERLSNYEIFPTPGVYLALTTLLVTRVAHSTTPLNFAMPAFTLTMPALSSTWLALMVTFALVFTRMPFVSSFTEFPLASVNWIEPGPSLSVTLWPPGVSTMKLSWPA